MKSLSAFLIVLANSVVTGLFSTVVALLSILLLFGFILVFPLKSAESEELTKIE